MKNTISRLKPAVAIAAVALFTATSASASYVVTEGGTSVFGEGLTTAVAGATVVNFNSSLSLPAGYTGGAVVNGSVGSNWASPPDDTSNYYTVGPGAGQSSPGTVLFASLQQYFGFYGGSLDTYNSVDLYRDSSLLFHITASMMNGVTSPPVGTNGNQSNGAYWNIFASNSTEYFNKVVFTSTTNAFETDNHASLSAVPLPAAVWLFGSGLLGLLGLSRRNRSAS